MCVCVCVCVCHSRTLYTWQRPPHGQYNDFFQFSTHEGLGVGGVGHFAIWCVCVHKHSHTHRHTHAYEYTQAHPQPAIAHGCTEALVGTLQAAGQPGRVYAMSESRSKHSHMFVCHVCVCVCVCVCVGLTMICSRAPAHTAVHSAHPRSHPKTFTYTR